MKIVFFGTSNVALPILEQLVKHFEVALVVTSPDALVGRKQTLSESPVSILANEMKLPILKPEKVKNNIEFEQKLKDIKADIFVVVSYGKILPLTLINIPKFKTINVHFSLLPKYRGPSPIQSAILNGEKETGISIFVLDELVDNGPILAQKVIGVDNDDNSISLSQKLAFASADLIVSVINSYTSGAILPEAQNHSKATHTAYIDKAHGKIDWQKTAQEIYNQFRAFYPWPGIWTVWKGNNIKILDCNLSPTPFLMRGEVEEGVVLNGGIVACGQNTFLQIKTLQMEGKKETKISDFLNGYKEFIGSQLN